MTNTMNNQPSGRTTPDSDPLSLDHFLCFALYSAGHAFTQFYRPLLDALDLTYPQYLVMTVLWSKDDQPVKTIGAALHLASNTLTPLLKRLENAGLVTRLRDGDDERQVRIRLTPKGLALREQARTVPVCVREAIGMTPEALAALQTSILAVRDRLEAQTAA